MCDPCCSPCGPCGPCSPCDPCCSPFEPRGCRSRELRSGIMYTTCECIKRNGLQDKCPRSVCQGRAACMNFPVPSCCAAAFPLRYANMTMGVTTRRRRCGLMPPPPCGGACGPCGPCGPCCGPCGPRACGGCSAGCCDTTSPCCGPHNPPCGAPCPVPCSPSPATCAPPMPESGIPDPRVWNACNTPASYPCGF